MLQIVRWRREPVDGDATIIVPPEGRAHGYIAVREGIRPLTSLRGVPGIALAELIGDDSPARTTTHEGELAAVIDDDNGTRAVIWGDVAQTEITGVAASSAARAAIATVVRELVDHLPLGLGLERLRRFWYRPPVGWRGVGHGLDAEWTSPDAVASIRVRPARPMRWSSPAAAIEQFVHDEQFFEFVLARPVTQEAVTIGPLRGKRGLAVGAVRGRPRTFITVAIDDDRVVYTARLMCDGAIADYEPVLDALVHSIEPLAKPRDAGADAHAIGHWAY